jgi:hypothetical protein
LEPIGGNHQGRFRNLKAPRTIYTGAAGKAGFSLSGGRRPIGRTEIRAGLGSEATRP